MDGVKKEVELSRDKKGGYGGEGGEGGSDLAAETAAASAAAASAPVVPPHVEALSPSVALAIVREPPKLKLAFNDPVPPATAAPVDGEGATTSGATPVAESGDEAGAAGVVVEMSKFRGPELIQQFPKISTKSIRNRLSQLRKNFSIRARRRVAPLIEESEPKKLDSDEQYKLVPGNEVPPVDASEASATIPLGDKGAVGTSVPEPLGLSTPPGMVEESNSAEVPVNREGAGTKIQSIWRGYVAGREAAATKIQTAMRGTRDRKKVSALRDTKKKDEAATKIQAAMRGTRDRKNVSDLREKKKTDEAAVATKIQAVVRGHMAREEAARFSASKGDLDRLNKMAFEGTTLSADPSLTQDEELTGILNKEMRKVYDGKGESTMGHSSAKSYNDLLEAYNTEISLRQKENSKLGAVLRFGSAFNGWIRDVGNSIGSTWISYQDSKNAGTKFRFHTPDSFLSFWPKIETRNDVENLARNYVIQNLATDSTLYLRDFGAEEVAPVEETYAAKFEKSISSEHLFKLIHLDPKRAFEFLQLVDQEELQKRLGTYVPKVKEFVDLALNKSASKAVSDLIGDTNTYSDIRKFDQAHSYAVLQELTSQKYGRLVSEFVLGLVTSRIDSDQAYVEPEPVLPREWEEFKRAMVQKHKINSYDSYELQKNKEIKKIEIEFEANMQERRRQQRVNRYGKVVVSATDEAHQISDLQEKYQIQLDDAYKKVENEIKSKKAISEAPNTQETSGEMRQQRLKADLLVTRHVLGEHISEAELRGLGYREEQRARRKLANSYINPVSDPYER